MPHDSDFSALDWQKRRFGDLEERKAEGHREPPIVSILRWVVTIATILIGAGAGLLLGAIMKG